MSLRWLRGFSFDSFSERWILDLLRKLCYFILVTCPWIHDRVSEQNSEFMRLSCTCSNDKCQTSVILARKKKAFHWKFRNTASQSRILFLNDMEIFIFQKFTRDRRQITQIDCAEFCLIPSLGHLWRINRFLAWICWCLYMFNARPVLDSEMHSAIKSKCEFDDRDWTSWTKTVHSS